MSALISPGGCCSPRPQFDHPTLANPTTAALVGGTAGGALYYNAFAYVNTVESGATLKAPSPPYVAASGLTVQATSGQRSWKTMNSRYDVVDYPRHVHVHCHGKLGS